MNQAVQEYQRITADEKFRELELKRKLQGHNEASAFFEKNKGGAGKAAALEKIARVYGRLSKEPLISVKLISGSSDPPSPSCRRVFAPSCAEKRLKSSA